MLEQVQAEKMLSRVVPHVKNKMPGVSSDSLVLPADKRFKLATWRRLSGRDFLMTSAGEAFLRSDAVERLQATAPTGTPGLIARDEDFWHWIQQAFAVDRNILKLNNGGVCPSPQVVQEAVRR
jgi:hypothetical protein